MGETEFQAGETVIKEGEAGDELFIVESGEYDCSKVIEGKDTPLKSYKHGEAFGELALMYNAPRQATIVCKTPGKLYKLDRTAFNQVVKEAATKKRELFKTVIDSIELFSSFDEVKKYSFINVDNSSRIF